MSGHCRSSSPGLTKRSYPSSKSASINFVFEVLAARITAKFISISRTGEVSRINSRAPRIKANSHADRRNLFAEKVALGVQGRLKRVEFAAVSASGFRLRASLRQNEGSTMRGC